MQHLWEEWMIEDGLFTGSTRPPATRADVASWCSTAYKDLPERMIQNSWRHGAYSFFPPPAANDATDNADHKCFNYMLSFLAPILFLFFLAVVLALPLLFFFTIVSLIGPFYELRCFLMGRQVASPSVILLLVSTLLSDLIT
jgi:glutathione S-transferase